MKTVLVSIAVVDPEHKPAYDVGADTLDLLDVLPATEATLIDFLRTLLKRAKLEGRSGDTRLFAGRVDEI